MKKLLIFMGIVLSGTMMGRRIMRLLQPVLLERIMYMWVPMPRPLLQVLIMFL